MIYRSTICKSTICKSTICQSVTFCRGNCSSRRCGFSERVGEGNEGGSEQQRGPERQQAGGEHQSGVKQVGAFHRFLHKSKSRAGTEVDGSVPTRIGEKLQS